MATAENLVSNFIGFISITNNYLFAFSDHDSINCSSIMSRALAAPTERFDLQGIYAVSKFY
jgi:hypothetical protein